MYNLVQDFQIKNSDMPMGKVRRIVVFLAYIDAFYRFNMRKMVIVLLKNSLFSFFKGV